MSPEFPSSTNYTVSQVASLLNTHEDKIFKLREKFEERKKNALTDLENDLLEERKRKYRQAIEAPDVPVNNFLAF
jgi:hypothetical protein